jgi:hypothetical protein
MSNLSAYAAAVQINDRLLEVYKDIGHNMPAQEVEGVRASLIGLAADLNHALDEPGGAHVRSRRRIVRRWRGGGAS